MTGGYSWWSRTIQSYEESITTLSGSVGAGVGLEVPTGAGPVLGFFVWPALLYHTYDYTFDGSETTYEESESDTHASLSFGAGFGIGRFFLSGAAEVTEDQKPEYGVQIGVRIW